MLQFCKRLLSIKHCLRKFSLKTILKRRETRNRSQRTLSRRRNLDNLHVLVKITARGARENSVHRPRSGQHQEQLHQLAVQRRPLLPSPAHHLRAGRRADNFPGNRQHQGRDGFGRVSRAPSGGNDNGHACLCALAVLQAGPGAHMGSVGAEAVGQSEVIDACRAGHEPTSSA